MSKRSLRAIGSVPSPPSAHRHRTSRRALGLHLTGQQWAAINPKIVKKALKKHARTLMNQVNLDWHDGYKEQEETCVAWLNDVVTYLQAVVDIGVGEAKAFKVCHRVLMLIGDSYRDLRANPIRVPLDDNFGDWDFQDDKGYLTLPWRRTDGKIRVCEGIGYGSANVLVHLCGFVWRALLKVCATQVAEAEKGSVGNETPVTAENTSATGATLDVEVVALGGDDSETCKEIKKKPPEDDVVDKAWFFGAIKDAHDNGIQLDKASEEFDELKNNYETDYDEDEDEDKVVVGVSKNIARILQTEGGGIATPAPDATALRTFVEQRDKWAGLEKTIRTFNMRRGIDHRFSGSHHLRTRDYLVEDDQFELMPSSMAAGEDKEDEDDDFDC